MNYKLEQGAATGARVLSRPAVTTAAEVLAIVKEAFGDQRGLSALLIAFHSRRQGIYERVLENA